MRHGLVKALAALSLAGCSGQGFTLSAAQLAAAEQKGFDRVLARQPDADVLFIAHQWTRADCRWSGWKTARCRTRARISDQTAWIAVTAKVREEDGAWRLIGANWPRH